MTPRNDRTLIALFQDYETADAAVARLLAADVPRERISVLCADNAPSFNGDTTTDEPAGTTRLPAAVMGGTIGSALGGLAVAVGLAGTGGMGLLVAGSVLGGAAAGGLTGGLLAALGADGPDDEIADAYQRALQEGRFVVTVAPADGSGPDQAAVDGVLQEGSLRADDVSAIH